MANERSGAVLIEDGKALIMHRRKAGVEYYAVIGGHIEPGESPEEACVREVEEETGLQVEIIEKLAQITNQGRTEHYYLVRRISGEPKLGGPEAGRQSDANFYELVWIPLEKIGDIALYPEEIARIIRKKHFMA